MFSFLLSSFFALSYIPNSRAHTVSFFFSFPITQYFLAKGLETYLFASQWDLLVPSLLITLLHLPCSVLVFCMDCSLFTSVPLKRMFLICSVLACISKSFFWNGVSNEEPHLHDKSLCFVILYSCSSIYAVMSALNRMVAMFTAAQLFRSIRSPNEMTILQYKVKYTVLQVQESLRNKAIESRLDAVLESVQDMLTYGNGYGSETEVGGGEGHSKGGLGTVDVVDSVCSKLSDASAALSPPTPRNLERRFPMPPRSGIGSQKGSLPMSPRSGVGSQKGSLPISILNPFFGDTVRDVKVAYTPASVGSPDVPAPLVLNPARFRRARSNAIHKNRSDNWIAFTIADAPPPANFRPMVSVMKRYIESGSFPSRIICSFSLFVYVTFMVLNALELVSFHNTWVTVCCQAASISIIVFVSLHGYDFNIWMKVIVKFNCFFPLLQYLGEEGLQVYMAAGGESLGPQVVRCITNSVAFVLIVTMDAAVFSSTAAKRLVLTIALVSVISSSIVNSYKVNNSDSLYLCYTILYSCSNPYTLISSLLRTVAMFVAKMLYHSFTSPHDMMVLKHGLRHRTDVS